jgi:hypothetical protein
MATRSYFESITSRSALEKHKHKHPPLYRKHTLPAASDWGTEELYASRVVVGPRRHRVLPYRALSSDAFLKPPPRLPSGAELSKIITPLPSGSEALTETELMHQLGGTAGMFWAALRRFTDPQPPSTIHDAEMRDLDGADDVEADHPPSSPILPQKQRARRRRAQQQYPDYVDSSRIKIASSSPTAGSQLSSSTTSDYISREEHGRRAVAEDATVELASAFLRHTLFQCPLQQHVTTAYPEDVLLEFSGIRRRMVATLRGGTLAFEATADGEVALLRRDDGAGRFISRGEVLGLLEAKKRLTVIREGRRVMTDQVLGQIVGEALALRLSLSAVEPSQGIESVFPPVYLFFSFPLSSPLYIIFLPPSAGYQ